MEKGKEKKIDEMKETRNKKERGQEAERHARSSLRNKKSPKRPTVPEGPSPAPQSVTYTTPKQFGFRTGWKKEQIWGHPQISAEISRSSWPHCPTKKSKI